MIKIKHQLKKACKTTSDYLNYLEDDRRNHDIKHQGGNLIIIDPNHGSANNIKIHECLLQNFEEFLKQ